MEAVQYLLNGLIRCIRRRHLALSPHAVGKELMVHILHHAERRALPPFPVQRLAIQCDLSGLFPQQAAQASGKGGLANTVGAGDGHHFPGTHGKRKILKHGWLLAVCASQPFYGQAGFAAGLFRCRETAGCRRQGPQSQPLTFPVSQGAELFPREGALQHSVPQIEGPVDEIGEKVQPVLRDHNRAALTLQIGDLVMKPENGVLVQIGRRFIQHKDFRAHSVDRAEGQQLLLSAGQGEDTPPQQILKMQCLHRIRHLAANLFRGTSLVFQTKGQFAVRVQVEELGFWVLEYGAYLSSQLVHRRFSRIRAVYFHPPFQAAAGGKGRNQAVDQFRHCGLPAAGGPAQQNALPRSHCHADLGESFLTFSISEGNMVHGNHRPYPPLLYHK